jgi:hypothetical protein
MKGLLQIGAIAALVLAACAIVGVAVAASPRKGGLYIGTIAGTEKRLEIHVAKDGKTATAAMFCFRQKVGAMPRFPIVNGKFKTQKTTGSIVVWAISGRFLSATKARASVALKTLCDGKGGLITLGLKRG